MSVVSFVAFPTWKKHADPMPVENDDEARYVC
jgi:hypothetical protein